MKKILSIVLAVSMLTAVFAGCDNTGITSSTTASTSASASGSETEIKYLKSDWTSINSTQTGFQPIFSLNSFENAMIFESLMKYDSATEAYVCELAKTVDVSADGTVYTVVLNDGVTFHDGEPLTADDVVFTYNLSVQVGSSEATGGLKTLKGYDDVVAGKATSMIGVYAKDAKTVVFEQTAPNFSFYRYLASSCLGIMPKHILGNIKPADVLTDIAFWSNPIGSGPYKVDEASYPNFCTLVSYDGYHGTKPGIEHILLTNIEDTQRTAALASGDMDFMKEASSGDADYVTKANDSFEMFVANATYSRKLWVQLSEKRLDDDFCDSFLNPRVRQAYNMIIDKDAIVKRVGVLASIATTLTAGAAYNDDIALWKRDVAGAVKILQEENYDFTHKVVIYTHYTDQESLDILQIIVQNLKEAGITASFFASPDSTTFIATKIIYDLNYCGSGGTGIDPYTLIPTRPQFNTDASMAAYHTAYDSLVADYRATLDPVKRQAALDKAQVASMEDMVVIPLWFRNTGWLINTAKVSGMPIFGSDFNITADMKFEDWKLLEQ